MHFFFFISNPGTLAPETILNAKCLPMGGMGGKKRVFTAPICKEKTPRL